MNVHIIEKVPFINNVIPAFDGIMISDVIFPYIQFIFVNRIYELT